MTVGLFVWGFGALFYLLGFFHRVAPAVITSELMRDFQISAAALGNLSAFYFYSYVFMQVPTGILADRWGPRRLLTAGALIASVGAVIFALAPTFGWAGVGRFLIGGSVAVAFVGLLKVAVGWFAPNRFALVSGLALFFGIVGAVFAGPPLRILVDHFGWRSVVLFSAVTTLLVGAGTWLFVRDYPHEKGYLDFSNPPSHAKQKPGSGILADLIEVFTYRNTILLFLIPGGMVGCVLTFSGLWGVPYLATVHGTSPAVAATLTSLLLVAWAVGGPFFGWLSDRLGNRKSLYVAGCGISVIGWIVIVMVNGLSLVSLSVVLWVTGFASGSMIISFAFVKESVPVRLSGTVSGVVNMGVMTGPMILQPAVGWVLDRMWAGDIASGVRVYSIDAYRSGFALMLAWITLSFVLLFFTRETGCRQTVE
ncbi:MFS transporter [Desulfosarcina widdelii]|uniref:Lysosomal dipeptide transporter MFSD1 n=2 Tax=Desulfosarcina widdelii TaxID=947919 RepID=A0A5K7YWC9_9BACT|nr:MFS transporter [Desulfosarcina widdelii]